jgi:phage-related minor tail protein
MRSALKSLMAPTKGMSDLMKRLGYSNGAAMIKALGFSGAISTVVKSAASSGAPLQTLMADMEGQTLALSLAGPLADDYTAKLAAMGDAAGTTDAAFKEQTKGINATGFSFKQVKAQAEVAAQKLGDGLAPALSAAMTAAQPLIDRIVRMADAFAKLPPETQTKIVGIAAAIAALGPALMVVGGAVSGLGAIVKFGGMMASLFGTIGAGGGGIAAIAGPVGIAIAAVAALAAGIAWLWKNNEEFRVGVTAAWDAIKGAFASVATEVGPLLTQIGVLLSALWENMGPGVVSIIVTTLQSLAAVVGVVFSIIGGIIRVVTLLLKGDFAGAWKFVSVTVQQVATNVMGTLAVLWGQITSSIASFATSLYQSGLGMWNSFINGIKAAAARVGEAVGGVVAKIRAFLPGSDAKIGPLSDITASGAALMTTLAGGIASAGGAPASALQGALSGLTTGAIDVGAFRGAQAAAVDATMGEATARLQQSGDVQSTVRVYVENGNIRAEMVDVAYGVQRVAAAGA